jgi:hypothetical protein
MNKLDMLIYITVNQAQNCDGHKDFTLIKYIKRQGVDLQCVNFSSGSNLPAANSVDLPLRP